MQQNQQLECVTTGSDYLARQIPWLRIVAEGIAIVASILPAFGIQAWWEGRVERNTLAAALDNLTQEVTVGRSELTAAVADNRLRIDLYTRFLNLTPDELASLPADSLESIGWAFFPPRTFDPGGGALQTLLVGRNLNAIRSERLPTALLAWARFPDEVDDDYRIATDVTQTFRERAAAFAFYPALLSAEQAQPMPAVPSSATALSALRRDPTAAGLVGELIVAHDDYTSQLAEGLTLADELLAAVADRSN